MQNLESLKMQIKNPVLIKKKENLFYLTGRSLENKAEEFLLITPKKSVAFGYGLEKIDWHNKVDRLKFIGKYLKGYNQLDIEYGFTYAEGIYISSKLSSLKLKVEPKSSVVDAMRQIKTADEITKVKKSMQIVEQVFKIVKNKIRKSDITEIKLAEFIRKNGLRLGAEDVSFSPIVASGANAAIPHHVPGNKKLKPGESIILDFGFKYKNYCSDFTRTVFIKKVGNKKIEEAYNQVEKAYNGSMEFISSHKKVTGDDVYQKSVKILAEKKLDKYFIHSLGHGTGLEIHELPNLSPKSKDILENNMVFSIEPGVYIPKLGGIRIEDLVYLKNHKVEKFINVSTKLIDNIF